MNYVSLKMNVLDDWEVIDSVVQLLQCPTIATTVAPVYSITFESQSKTINFPKNNELTVVENSGHLITLNTISTSLKDS